MMLLVPGQPNAKARLAVSREYVYESR